MFYKTDYKNFIGTNKSIAKEKFHIYIGEIERSIMNSKEGYKNLNNSVLSNDLATATTIITKDKKIILAQRSNEVYLLKGLIHTSIAEGMHFENDWDENISSPNPLRTIKRGAKEELNIDIELDNIEILAVGIYTPYAQPFIVAKVEIDKTYEEVVSCFKEREHSFEGNIFAVDFNITELSPFLFDRNLFGHSLKMADLGKVSILQCLIQKYGKNKLEKKLRESYKIVQKYF